MRRGSQRPPIAQESLDEDFRRCIYGALLEKYGSLDSIPEEEMTSALKLCEVPKDDEEWVKHRAHSPSPVRSYTRTPPRQVASKVRGYINDRPRSARHATAVQQDSFNLRRVLNEIQLRMPALRRLQQQHGGDLDTEFGQAKSFSDVFTLLDEDGSGAVSLDEFVAFGRRVGGECAKVFNKKLFYRIDIDRKGEMTKDEFIDVLFPRYAAQRRKREMAEQQALQRKREAARWEDEYHAQHLATISTIFSLCDIRQEGSVSLNDIAKLYCVRPHDKWPAGKRTLREDYASVAPEGDVERSLSLQEFALLLKGNFGVPPSTDAEEITDFYYETVSARW